MNWYRQHARVLPWRDTTDPYRIWVSEIMLQQTRVAAVIEHYTRIPAPLSHRSSRSPSPKSPTCSPHGPASATTAARACCTRPPASSCSSANGRLPATSAELRTLPGIGDYTAAAIASIAFGESVAVVDGNVERVILRLARPRRTRATAAARTLRPQAGAGAHARSPHHRRRRLPQPVAAPQRPHGQRRDVLVIAAAATPRQPARRACSPPSHA